MIKVEESCEFVMPETTVCFSSTLSNTHTFLSFEIAPCCNIECFLVVPFDTGPSLIDQAKVDAAWGDPTITGLSKEFSSLNTVLFHINGEFRQHAYSRSRLPVTPVTDRQ